MYAWLTHTQVIDSVKSVLHKYGIHSSTIQPEMEVSQLLTSPISYDCDVCVCGGAGVHFHVEQFGDFAMSTLFSAVVLLLTSKEIQVGPQRTVSTSSCVTSTGNCVRNCAYVGRMADPNPNPKWSGG